MQERWAHWQQTRLVNALRGSWSDVFPHRPSLCRCNGRAARDRSLFSDCRWVDETDPSQSSWGRVIFLQGQIWQQLCLMNSCLLSLTVRRQTSTMTLHEPTSRAMTVDDLKEKRLKTSLSCIANEIEFWHISVCMKSSLLQKRKKFLLLSVLVLFSSTWISVLF